jgi:hypothetical protein
MKKKPQIVFSGYWPVSGNPKKSNRQDHIFHAQKKSMDFFLCGSGVNFSNAEKILIDELPSLPYIKNLESRISSQDFVYLKFGQKIKSDAFFRLTSIWCSKILFFDYLHNINNADYYIWRDCVNNIRYDKIFSSNKKGVTCNKYCTHPLVKNPIPHKPFKGLLSYNFGPKKTGISASVIKIKSESIPEVVEKYKECLMYADKNFEIFDEEIVLSYMFELYPKLFNFID